MASRPGAEYARREGRPYAGRRRLLRFGQAADRAPGADDPGACRKNLGTNREANTRRAALGPRHELGRLIAAAGVAPDYQHRRTRRRVYGAGRQDGATAQSSSENRHAAGSRHDRSRYAGQAESASREARIRRCRGQYERWIRPDSDRTEQQAHPNAALDLPELGLGSAALDALGGLMAGLRVHKGAAESAGGSFRIGARHRRARTG